MMRSGSYRWAGVAVTAIGLFATAVSGQPARVDPVDAAKTQQSIAEQKAESDVLLQINNAAELAKGNLPEKAVQTLKNAKANLQVVPGISDATRTRLTAMLDAKIAGVAARASNTPATGTPGLTAPGQKLDPKAADVKKANEAAAARYFDELKDVRLGIERIRDYEAKGQTANANAEIARLAKAYPNNPAVLPLTNNDTIRNRLQDAKAYYAEYNSRWVADQKSIRESALPAIRDVEFPKDWVDRTRLRNKKVELSAKEKKIIEALDKPITVSFQERPFDEALQDISNMLDQPLLLDKKSLDDLGLDLKKGSTLQAKGLSGRTVLRSVLAAQGLTFVVKDETIQIVTVERAKTMLTTRVYYLGDLVQGVGQFGGIQWGPFLNAQQTQANVAALIDTIKKIDPLSWNGEAGGPGSITYHAPTQSIIVRNSAEVHSSLSAAFGQK
jgi:type II secretory pathway component GspD/PulD (secretin)